MRAHLTPRIAHDEARALLPEGATASNGGFEFQVHDEGIEPVLTRLIERGYGVASLSVERPGLHEVFVKLVREAEA
jgi:ABC-2 type transport system ATP-binding protein